jgi:CheY-like chemotaxis protein
MVDNIHTGGNSSQAKTKKSVLVVDDSELICFLIKSILEKDFDVEIKSDGQEALNYLNRGNHPDIILLDMLMPNMNGRTFARRVHNDPRYGNIPIIFITTVNSTMLSNSFKSMGIVDYIVKPFVNDDLLAKVKSVLNVS